MTEEALATPGSFCYACGNSVDPRAELCPQCGVRQKSETGSVAGKKSKIAAAILALLFGGIGVHKFYLGRVAQGVLYLLFCWTFIPSLIAFIEFIVYLFTSDEEFARKYG